jgi:DNA-binding transcriptional ArsR family regulator
MERKKLSEEALALIAGRFKLLGEGSRLKLIIALEEGEKSVGELVEDTGLTQANVSRHLSALVVGGILSRRKEGLSVYHAIADPEIFDMCESVCGSLQKSLGARAKAFR